MEATEDDTYTALRSLFESAPRGTYRDGDGSRISSDLDALELPHDLIIVRCEQFWSALGHRFVLRLHGRYWNRGVE